MNTPKKSFSEINQSPQITPFPDFGDSRYFQIHRTTAPELPSPYFSRLVYNEIFGTPSSTLFNVSFGSEKARIFPKAPYKVLDAPNLADDFYLNVVDWSIEDVISVGLKDQVYSLNPTQSKVSFIGTYKYDWVTSLKWSEDGSLLAVGTKSGLLEIFDYTTMKTLLKTSQETLISSFAWNGNILVSNEGEYLKYRDLRDFQVSFGIEAHEGHICNLEWSSDKRWLASGSNDETVKIWEMASVEPCILLNSHIAAVRALAWNPHNPGEIVTGGGSADRSLKIWDLKGPIEVASTDTGHEITGILYSKTGEVVSSQGEFVQFWSSSLEKIGVLPGHSQRILYLAFSPDESSVLTGSADETLKFWKISSLPEQKEELSMFYNFR